MKVPVDDYACLDLYAPTLPAHEIAVDGVTRWRVLCKYRRSGHFYGPGEGHREAHCHDSNSPYLRSGYNLALAL